MDCPPEGACRYGFFTLRQNSPCSPGCVLRDPVESRALCTRYGVLTYLGRSDTRPSFVLSLFSFPQGSSKWILACQSDRARQELFSRMCAIFLVRFDLPPVVSAACGCRVRA